MWKLSLLAPLGPIIAYLYFYLKDRYEDRKAIRACIRLSEVRTRCNHKYSMAGIQTIKNRT